MSLLDAPFDVTAIRILFCWQCISPGLLTGVGAWALASRAMGSSCLCLLHVLTPFSPNWTPWFHCKLARNRDTKLNSKEMTVARPWKLASAVWPRTLQIMDQWWCHLISKTCLLWGFLAPNDSCHILCYILFITLFIIFDDIHKQLLECALKLQWRLTEALICDIVNSNSD